MPIGPAHSKQRSKNRLALAIILAVVGGLYYLTILKISGQ